MPILSPAGHYLIMVIPLVIMPVSSMLLGRYSRTFGVERYPFPPERIASAVSLYAGAGVSIACYSVPGIHTIWAAAALALFCTSLEGNLKLTRSRHSLAPYRVPLAVAIAAIALWVGFGFPDGWALALWALAATALQLASVVVLLRAGGARSPATGMITWGYALGIVGALMGAWMFAHALTGLWIDVLLVVVALSSLLMSIGASTYVLETTATALAGTRDRIAAEVEARTAELRAANERLRETDRQKDQFLSTVSHELRTPLTTIKGYAEFLEDEIEGPLTIGNRAYVGAIQDAVGLLGHKVDDLLDLARITTGSLRLETAPFHLEEVLIQLAGLMHPLLLARGQTLALTHGHGLAMVGDRLRIQQVFINLVQNACKFSPDGAAIALTATDTPDAWRVAVTDSGVGIPEAHLREIFQAFYQVDGTTTREHAGIGMGLSIAMNLVEAHGGRIEVESEPGRGSTFTVVLPKAPAAVAAGQGPQA